MKIWLLYFIGILIVLDLRGQDQSTSVAQQVLPPSPDAASLGKYGEVPVGTYTGIPQIDIPLHEIDGGAVKMPVSISYHAGGHKVEDIASNIGLGWVLNAGGVITRTVLGRPDETNFGFLSTDNTLPVNMANISDANMKLIAQNKLDGQPDMFYFNFGNYSGKLIFDKSGNCHSIPHNNFKIKPSIGPFNNGANSWEITTEDGIKYTFAAIETSTVLSGGSPGVFYDIPTSSFITQTYTSSWFLTRVQAPHTGDYINFQYANQTFQNDISASTSHYLSPGQNYFTSSFATITLNSKILDNITFPGGSIKTTTASRNDVTGALRITELTIKDYNGDFVKKFQLDNSSYFQSNGCNSQVCKRLKLSSVLEVGKNELANKPYTFAYNATTLPPRDSFNKDHWGYFNNANNDTAIPEFIDYNNESADFDFIEGANRSVNESAAKAAILTKVIYPTGGYTEFDYESNQVVSSLMPNENNGIAYTYRIDGTFSNPNQESQTFTIEGSQLGGLYVTVTYQTVGCSTSSIPSLQANCPSVQIVGVGNSFSTVFQSGNLSTSKFFLANGQYKLKGSKVYTGQSYFIKLNYTTVISSSTKTAGGLRVSRISESDGINSNLNVRKFNYNEANGNSTGRLNGYPRYTYPVNKYQECLKLSFFVISQESSATLGSAKGSYVGYGKVTELKGENGEYGMSEYFYTSVWKSETESTSIFLDNNQYSLPFGPPPVDNEYKRGYLIRKIDYKYPSIKVKESIKAFQDLGSPTTIYGLKASIYDENTCTGSAISFKTSLMIRYGGVSYVPQYAIERMYNSDGVTYAETRSDYTFSPTHRQLTQEIKTLDSTPSTLWKRRIVKKYPPDFVVSTSTNDDMSEALKKMNSPLHIHNAVIEKQEWEVRNAGTEKLVNAEINLYKANGYEMNRQLRLQVSSPLSNSDYISSYVNSSSTGTFVYDNGTVLDNGIQKPKFKTGTTFDQFDASTGNIQQLTSQDGVKRSYLWAFNNGYPVAEATNAPYGSIFYTSFEEPSGGNWSSFTPVVGDAATGSKSFVGTIETAQQVDPGKYIVSFWAKGSGNVNVNGVEIPVTSATVWSPYLTTIAVTSNQKINVNSNNNKIDELRAYPADALMKTFTYFPLIGISSAADESNMITNYKYDDLNRLQSVIDHAGNLTKRIHYNIKGHIGTPPGSSLNAEFYFSGAPIPDSPIGLIANNSDPSVKFDWDFGDGTSAFNSTKTISHIYQAGIYLAQLTVRKGDLANYSQARLKVETPPPPPPTWDAPSIILNSASIGPVITPPATFPPSVGLIHRVVNISVTASPSGSGGVMPYKNYIWTYEGESMSAPITINTTTPNATFSFQERNYQQPPCALPFGYNYSVTCKIVDANDVTSKQALANAYVVPQDPMDVSASSFIFNNSSGSGTITVTNAAGNLTVTPGASWIHINSITQCNSFTFNVDSNFISSTIDTDPRSGTITLSTPRGNIPITISQEGYTYSRCGEGCYWNETQSRCECP